MRKIRLLHITATHLNLTGGIPVVLRDLVNAQNNIDGFEARVLSVRADITNIKSSSFDFLGNRSFEKYLSDYNPNVVIFHSHYYLEYVSMSRTLRKRGIPYFIEPHGSFGVAALQKSKYRKIVANYLVLNTLLRKAKGYIFLNESEKLDSKFHAGLDLVIPNGIYEEDIVEEYDAIGEWSFYFVGRFDIRHKGLDILFDALDILEQRKVPMKLNLFGTGSASEIEYVNERVKKYDCLQVQNCGPVYGDDQKQRLEKHGIMILSSRYEGFPMTVLEAWKYGNPCLVTPGTNVQKEIVMHELGWGTSLDAHSIADAMIKAQNEYISAREDYIIRCKKYVKDTYSWDRLAQISYEKLSEICM